jgi:hypothetical protein
MDIEEFEDLVDRLGEDLAAWPDHDRKAAEVLLRNSAEAREIISEATSLRMAFARRPTAPAPAGLADRIIVQATSLRPPQPQPQATVLSEWLALLGPQFPFSRPAVILYLCFAAGLALSLSPVAGRRTASQVEVPTLFQACCGQWSAARNE